MKNILVVLSFVSIGITTLYAQLSNRYDWGIEGGPNLSTFRMSKNPYKEAKPMIYGSAGFIFQFNMKKILSFKTGFSYQRKGYLDPNPLYVNDIGNYLGPTKNVYTYDYITLPLLVKASFGKQVKFFVNAGPYVGFLIGRKKQEIYDHDVVYETSGASSYQRFDFGVAGGIGITIPIKKSWMMHAEVRNYFGLQNVTDAGAIDMYTNTTDLRLGVVYRLGFRDSE